MTEFTLEAKTREGKASKTRNSGMVPGVIYGKGFDTTKISLDELNFAQVFKLAGTSNLIDLKIDGKNSVKTLIHEIQHDPLYNSIIHVDFFKVNMKEKIHAEIPLKFVGDSKAVIEQEGTLLTPATEIEVECLPSDLVSELEIDISALDNFEKNIKVEDIKVPAGIEVLSDPEEVVAYVEEPRSDEELAELEEEVVEDVESVEVEQKGEEEGAEGEGEEKPAEATEEK